MIRVSLAAVLYDPADFERLTDERWDPARVEDAIATIVADAGAAFDPDALWPADEWDGWEEPLPLKTLYLGAAGVIWALDALRRRGHAATSLDLAAGALRTLELERSEPDSTADEHYRPASLLRGETGPLLVAYRLAPDPALADDLHALVRANVANPTDDIAWGAPGTLLAALAMGEWTGEAHWQEAARETATALRARRGDDGLWRQDDDYRGLGTANGAAGNTRVLLRFEPDDALAAETAALLARHAFRGNGLANWPGTPLWRQLRRPRDGRICLQWCTGAPGILAGASEYLDEELVLAGAELIWTAGAHSDEKGHGLCHGTSGNGFALLKAFARTGDERWLERARRFAVHALGQAERLRAANGRGRYSLWTGDVGTALFAAACLDADARYPILDAV
ncbi:MAG: LanC-like protein [Actinomycetota bacterium]|nr:LanC-like protein [Actinomycetota bacterium]